MKSCLGLLIVLITFTAVVGGGAGLWYLSSTSEFTRTAAPGSPSGTTPPPAPKAQPVAPKPQARPVVPARPVAPKPAAPQRPASPFGDNAPPEIPR